MDTDLIIEIAGVAAGLLYLFFEIKHSNWMWVLGMLMAALYIYLFAAKGLYASMSYQIYYFAMSIYGLAMWKRESKNKDAGKNDILLRKLELRPVLVSSLLAAAFFLLLVFVLGDYTDDSQPVLDSLSTSISLLATYWLSRSYKEQWLLWIAADALCIAMYIHGGLYPTAGLYLVYTLSAVYGYYYWRKKGRY